MGKFWYIDSSGKRKRTAAGIKHQKEEWESSAKAKAKNAARSSARRAAIRKGLVHRNDGKDVDHIRGVSAGNGSSNIRILSAHENRGRRQGSRKRGSKRARRKD